jgi:hypothetical protein
VARPLFYFAIAGWILGSVVHIASLAKIDVTDKVSFVWVLHVGVLAIWAAMILLLRNEQGFKGLRQDGRANPVGFSKVVFKGTPAWLVYVAIGGFFYAMLNFILFAVSQRGVPAVWDGQYVLHDHGNLIKNLTEEEYHQSKANEVRGFSGHWIAFYGLAIAILYPFALGGKGNRIQADQRYS